MSVSRPEGIAVRRHWFGFGDCCLAVSERYQPDTNPTHEGPVLFFLHGRFGQAECWSALSSALAGRFRCFEIDLPGFGRSYTLRKWGHSLLEHSRMVHALLERFAHKSPGAVLVGHDVGGAIAQLCAIHAPERVSSIVLMNSTMLTQKPVDLRPGLFCARTRRKLRRLFSNCGARIGPAERDLLLLPWRRHATRRTLSRAFEAWDATWPGLAQRSVWRKELRSLRHPVLLLSGGRDLVNSPDDSGELLRGIPDAYLFEHDDCGHWPYLEEREWVLEKMNEFLFRTGEGASSSSLRRQAW